MVAPENTIRSSACRVTECVPDTSEVLGSFYCQGKCRSGEKPLCGDAAGAPGRSEAECERKNFDEALSHPDEKDFADARQWAQTMVDAV